ncbi:MAG: PEP-CTERM sorting domain-containing protein [Deltaproteobacteria bacterium]|nr:MAG: PEP-CTERM sorting domain-containing protein [Deltaproteobacteria bacterium]
MALVAPQVASAEGPVSAEEVERPATWDMTVEELRAIGLGQYRGDPVPVPPDAPLAFDPDEPRPAKQGVIFVNFDGANLQSGWDNSKTNTTQISQLAGPFAAYGQGSKREATMQAVRDDWAPFNVIVTDTRPASGDYTMNMTGPTNPFGGGVLGIAPLDCNDSQTHNNITFAFHSANDQFSASTQATTIGQEVAHSYGLEHVDEPGDIMNPYNAGGNPSFTDQCIQIVSNQGIVCGSQHAAQCGSSNMQNSYRELLALFGPAQADDTPPSVTITSPADGAMYEAGASFQITADASDDVGVQQVDLYVDGSFSQSDGTAPYGWNVENIPAGTYTFYAVARDLSGNEAQSNEVTIEVTEAGGSGGDPSGGDPSGGDPSGGDPSGGDPSGGDPSGGDPSGGDPSGGDPSGGTGSGGGSGEPPPDEDSGPVDTGPFPPGYGERGMEDGCACTATEPNTVAPLALVGLFLFGRRRRRV